MNQEISNPCNISADIKDQSRDKKDITTKEEMSADEGAAGSEEREWRRRVMSSPEVQEVQDSIMFQRIKIRQLHMDLHEAESLDSELEERLKAQENKVRDQTDTDTGPAISHIDLTFMFLDETSSQEIC